MCRIYEGGELSHVGVELRSGLYADRLDDGSLALCQHPSGDLRLPAWEVILTERELAVMGLTGSLAPLAPPETETVAAALPAFVPLVVVKRKHVAKSTNAPVRTKPELPKTKKKSSVSKERKK